MNRVIHISFLLFIISIILVSGCTQNETSGNNQQTPQGQSCPSCDDGNACTKDYCSNETAYRCRHDLIAPCCGNQQCEAGETYINCLSDCPKPRVSTKDPSEMVLKLEDLPSGFSINESKYRTRDDVSPEALAQGWKTGYGVIFEKMEEFIAITNYNSIYSADNISFTLEQTRKDIESSNTSVISAPKIGDDSVGYKEVLASGIIPIVRYTIEFRKYDVYEVVSIAGIGGKVSADDVVKYAQIVEKRIS